MRILEFKRNLGGYSRLPFCSFCPADPVAADPVADGTVIYDESFTNTVRDNIPEVTNLTGDSKDYTIVVFNYDASSGSNFWVELNNDTSEANYTANAIESNGGSTTGRYSTSESELVTVGWAERVGFSIIKLTGISGSRRLIRSSGMSCTNPTTVSIDTADVQWENTANEVVSLRVSTGSSTRTFNGRIVVYEHGKAGNAQMGNLELVGTESWAAASDTKSFTGLDGDTDEYYRIFTDFNVSADMTSNIQAVDTDGGRSNVRSLAGTLSVQSDTSDLPEFPEGDTDRIMSAKTGFDRPMMGRDMSLIGSIARNTYHYATNTATNITNIDFVPLDPLTGSAHLYKSTNGMFDTLPFELVETKVLSATAVSAASPIQFSGLTGDSEFLYKITASVHWNTNVDMSMRFNNDSTTDAYIETRRTNITSSFSDFTEAQVAQLSLNERSLIEIYIYPNKGGGVERPYIAKSVGVHDYIKVTGGMYDNTVDEIVSIELYPRIGTPTVDGIVTLSKLRIV